MKKSKGKVAGLLLKAAAVIVALYFCASYISLRSQLNAAQKEYEELRATHAIEQQKTAELADLVASGITDRYVISVARERGYILPGEHVYVDIYGQ